MIMKQHGAQELRDRLSHFMNIYVSSIDVRELDLFCALDGAFSCTILIILTSSSIVFFKQRAITNLLSTVCGEQVFISCLWTKMYICAFNLSLTGQKTTSHALNIHASFSGICYLLTFRSFSIILIDIISIIIEITLCGAPLSRKICVLCTNIWSSICFLTKSLRPLQIVKKKQRWDWFESLFFLIILQVWLRFLHCFTNNANSFSVFEGPVTRLCSDGAIFLFKVPI